MYDGGADIHNALGLSGEPMVSQISAMYGERREEASASKISANNIAKREYQKEYMEYWNNTTHLTSTGRPVDAIIAPLAPFAAARPGRYKYYGCTYSRSLNLLLSSLKTPYSRIILGLDKPPQAGNTDIEFRLQYLQHSRLHVLHCTCDDGR